MRRKTTLPLVLSAALALALLFSGAPTPAQATQGTDQVLSSQQSASISYRVRYASTWKAASDGATAGSGTVNAIRVYKPAITTVTKKLVAARTQDEPAQEVEERDTVSYGISLSVNVIGVGTKKGSYNDGETYRQYSSTKAIQAVSVAPSASFLNSGWHLYYRVKVKTFGWLGWAKDGENAGSKQGTCIQAMQMTVAKSAPGPTARAFITAPQVSYAVDQANKNSAIKSFKKGGASAGKATYKGKTERLRAKVSGGSYSGGISYRVRTGKKDSGWSAWTANGAICGVNGSAKGGKRGVQAVQMKLTGALAKYYDLYYSTYCGDHHWLGWAKNGAVAGTGKINYPIGAIRVAIVAKGTGAPGSTKGRYVTKKVKLKGAKLSMLRRAQKFSSSTKYLILVNRSSCHVAVFQGSHNDWTMKYYWSCCVGKPSTPTIAGNFTTKAKMYSFGEKKGYSCYYATQISGEYLFHSTLYYKYTRNVMDSTLGAQISHGCVRLAIKNAQWIYNNVGWGTKVHIY